MMKRVFDLIFATSFFLVFWPIFLVTYILLKILSPGPAMYKARRVGLNGKIFTCYKFRSMKINSGNIKITTLKNDDRIFPFGNFLRKSKIDEFPQIFNILTGDMSVVGPRPEDETNADDIYIGKYKEILSAKPGLTSIGSLYDYTHGERYENESDYIEFFLPQKLNLELYYVQKNNFLYDIEIIIKTALTIILIVLGKKKFSFPKELSECER